MRYGFFASLAFTGIVFFGVWAQTENVRPNNYSEAIVSSDLIVIGKAISSWQVVRADKVAWRDSTNRPALPNPNEYVLANEVVIAVSAWLKTEDGLRKQKTLRVLVPGRLPKHGDPNLVLGEEFLLFLTKADVAELNKTYSNVSVLRKGSDPVRKENSFNPSDYYFVNGRETGVISGRDKIKELSAVIRSELSSGQLSNK